MSKSMINLLKSKKALIEFMKESNAEEQMDMLKEWGLVVMLMMSSLKSIITQPEYQEVLQSLEQASKDIDSTIQELQIRGGGYNGPIGQA